MDDLRVIVGTRDRPKEMVGKFIESLKNQTKFAPVTIVDFGSDDGWLSNLNSFEVKVIRVERDYWSKQRAINIGAKHSPKSKYILITDIDCIFEPNFIEVVFNRLLFRERLLVVCYVEDMTSDGRKDVNPRHKKMALGACMALSRKWFVKVRGMDEFYTYWGLGDNDFIDRALSDGYRLQQVHHITTIWHQWHEKPNAPTLIKNKQYYKLKNKPLVRNLNGWGELNEYRPKREVEI